MDNSYTILYDALTDLKKTMKANLLSFSTEEIHCLDISYAKFVKERKKLFGTYYIIALVWSISLYCLLFDNFTLF